MALNRLKILKLGSQLFGKQSNGRNFNVWSSCKFSTDGNDSGSDSELAEHSSSPIPSPSPSPSPSPTPTSTPVPAPAKPLDIDRSSIVTNQPPLTEPLPDLPNVVYASSKSESHSTRVTTLGNGIRVASENRYGQFCTVGVIIDSGCRYEASYPSGVSHFLEKLAFSSTSLFPDKDKILLELEKYGGICDCQSSRDTFIYAASVENGGLEAVTQILGEIVLRPQITEKEVELARQTVQFELESLLMRPEQEVLLMDMIHAAAYRDNTLGLPKLCPTQNLNKIDRNILFTFLKNHYAPERIVVAGVGVEHGKLLEAVNEYFVDTPAIWDEEDSLALPDKLYAVDNSVAQYTGGMIQESCEIPLFAGPSGLPELTHIVMGFEGFSHQDPDFIAVCVLNMIMGGGGSFSAGGPGKGMYTRLYTNVLNRHHWMFSATAYNHAYADTGIFCIHASCPPNHVRELVQVILREMMSMAGSVCPVELRRAKTQLQSMLLMNLESRAVVFEDIGRQVLSTGQRKPPQHFIDLIESTTAADIQRVAKRLLRSQPSIAARGDLKRMPTLQDIQSAAAERDGRLPGKLSLLRNLVPSQMEDFGLKRKEKKRKIF